MVLPLNAPRVMWCFNMLVREDPAHAWFLRVSMYDSWRACGNCAEKSAKMSGVPTLPMTDYNIGRQEHYNTLSEIRSNIRSEIQFYTTLHPLHIQRSFINEAQSYDYQSRFTTLHATVEYLVI
jgi:hypothetical protein